MTIMKHYLQRVICYSYRYVDLNQGSHWGGGLWPFGNHFFGAEKWELLKIFGKNWVQ